MWKDIQIRWGISHNIVIAVFCISHYLIGRLEPNERRDIFNAIDPSGNDIQVFCMERPISIRLKAFIRFGGGMTHYIQRVCSNTINTIHKEIFKAHSDTEEDYEHKYTPKYSESGKEATPFITCNSMYNFLKTI